MKLVTFETAKGYHLGAFVGNKVADVMSAGEALGISLPASIDEFYRQGNAALPALQELMKKDIPTEFLHDEASLTIGPAVPNPGKILCVGLNYRKHAAESGMAEPKLPVLFSKFNNTIAAPGEDVPITDEMKAVDYEAELVVIMGKEARHVSETDALNYVFGYCNGNDLSERHLQFLSGQWLVGKTPDKFMPIGPYVITADEAGDPQNMTVKGWYNGEMRQNSNTADMIFSVAQVIAYTSKYMTLLPGDIISTGTPEGVIMGTAEKIYMKPGDEYVIEIGNLGRLTNKIVES